MKMNLNETWKLCLQMWKWVAKNYNGSISVNYLKERWCEEHDFAGDKQPENSCFFCDYVEERGRDECELCPGRKVDPDFDCYDEKYSFDCKPKEFYKKLVQLNKKRMKV
jgi:hypothetical protein